MKHMNNHWRVPMSNLQLFAGEGGDDGGNNDDGGSDHEDKPVSFDDFLKEEGNQAEFDRRVQKAVNTAVTNAQEKWKALTDDKLTEAEKLAKMTKEEKAEYKNRKLEKELEDLKRQNAVTEMAKTARKMLADEEINIPDELLGHLVSESAEDTKAAVEAFSKMYKTAVQAAVKDALKGNPPKGGTGGKTMTKEQIMAISNPVERQRLIAENIALFQ
nr:MAG TPA: Major capsid protein [Caudoviricetes sp.]